MKETRKSKTLEDYLNASYPYIVYPAEEGGYVGEIEELPGCMTQAETLEELSERIENARRAWIQMAYENGMEIPLPRLEQEYSGKFVIRLPKYLHRRLAERAEREGVSLNQFVVTLLSSAASGYRMVTAGSIDFMTMGTGIRCWGGLANLTPFPWDVQLVTEPTEWVEPYQVIVGKAQELPVESVAV
jgi:predicted RNase H-like HicB family nuclease